MRTPDNILWFMFEGLLLPLMWGIVGAGCCGTIIAVLIGIQCFKFASVVFAPLAGMLFFKWRGKLLAECYLEGLLWCITKYKAKYAFHEEA